MLCISLLAISVVFVAIPQFIEANVPCIYEAIIFARHHAMSVQVTRHPIGGELVHGVLLRLSESVDRGKDGVTL